MKIALTDGRINIEAAAALSRLGFTLLTLPQENRLPPALSSHTDMLVAALGSDLITYADYCDKAAYVFTDLMTLAPHLRMHFSSSSISDVYPQDAALNVLVMGNKLYGRLSSVDPMLLSLAKERGLELRNVKQGYPACTVLKLNDGAAITADKGMAAALIEDGIRVTVIENGDISLPPYEYGFIGGCAGVCEGRVMFLGDVKSHRSFAAIKDAILAEGMSYISLCDGPLTDLGGILFIC